MFRSQNSRHLFRLPFFTTLHIYMTSPFVIVKVKLSQVSLSNFFHFRLDMELDDLPKKRLKELIFEETGSFTPRPQPPPEQGQQQPHQVWRLTHFYSVSFCKKNPGGQMQCSVIGEDVFLSNSQQQLPHFGLGPFRGFLS